MSVFIEYVREDRQLWAERRWPTIIALAYTSHTPRKRIVDTDAYSVTDRWTLMPTTRAPPEVSRLASVRPRQEAFARDC